MIEGLEEPSTDGMNSTDQSTSISSMIENSKSIFGSGSEDREMMETTSIKEDGEVTGQSNVGANVLENLMVVPVDEENNETKDQVGASKTMITEINVDAEVSEAIYFEMESEEDKGGISEIINSEINANNMIEKSSREGINEMMITDQSISMNSLIENLKNVFGSYSEDREMMETASVEEYSEVTDPSNVGANVEENLMDVPVNEIKDQIGTSETAITENKKPRNAPGSKRKRKMPPISEMVLDSVKSLKSNDGVSFEDIKEFMEEKYPVTVRALIKYNVNNFLQKCVGDGTLEEIGGADSVRFRFKESAEKPVAPKEFKLSLQRLSFSLSNMKKQ